MCHIQFQAPRNPALNKTKSLLGLQQGTTPGDECTTHLVYLNDTPGAQHTVCVLHTEKMLSWGGEGFL